MKKYKKIINSLDLDDRNTRIHYKLIDCNKLINCNKIRSEKELEAFTKIALNKENPINKDTTKSTTKSNRFPTTLEEFGFSDNDSD